jgi:hypothetical protein
VAEVFRYHKGRWWFVAGDARDLPPRAQPGRVDTVYARIYPTGSNPEPPVAPERYHRWPILSRRDGQYHRYARLNFVAQLGGDYYDGIFLAPLPGDHPHAWRCYNEQTLRRAVHMTHLVGYRSDPVRGDRVEVMEYGLVALRTQVRADRVRQALHIARTFDQAVTARRDVGGKTYRPAAPGWALVAIRPEGIDLLLLGPPEALQSGQGRELLALLKGKTKDHYDTFFLEIEKLQPDFSSLAPIFVFNLPGERMAGVPTLRGLREHLELVDKRYGGS